MMWACFLFRVPSSFPAGPGVVVVRIALAISLLSITLFASETIVAQAPQPEAKEVPHPALPAGAGTIDADAAKTFSTTASGLQYRVLRKGAGPSPKATSNVKVHYHGWLDGGKVFDSSYQRGESIDFPLNGVIPGWTEGMQLVGKGGMIELVIPSNLGYGKRGTPGGPIPPDATLHFLVELLDVR
jgi:FKBP-type peptidyl-prolyl cis-trans isomerase